MNARAVKKKREEKEKEKNHALPADVYASVSVRAYVWVGECTRASVHTHGIARASEIEGASRGDYGNGGYPLHPAAAVV